jgi:hypothetical protein
LQVAEQRHDEEVSLGHGVSRFTHQGHASKAA